MKRCAEVSQRQPPAPWVSERSRPARAPERGDSPFLILDAPNDQTVHPQQSEELAWDLGANGVPHELVSVTQGGHGFSTQGETPDEAAIIHLVVAFFVRTLVSHQPLANGA